MSRRSKLSAQQWADVAARIRGGESRRALAREFEISESALREYLARQRLVGAPTEGRETPVPSDNLKLDAEFHRLNFEVVEEPSARPILPTTAGDQLLQSLQALCESAQAAATAAKAAHRTAASAAAHHAGQRG